MAQVVADFRHPDGGVSMFNDCGLYFAYSPDDCLTAYQHIRGYKITAQQHISLKASGYFGLRNNLDLILIDCAELAPQYLPAHGHGDALAFEWTVEGQRVFVDAGVYEYNPGNKRDYSRSTTSHNTVNLDGIDQSEFWKAFRVGRRARITKCEYIRTPKGFQLTGAHNGYTRLDGSPTHHRHFDVTVDQISINDQISGGHGQLAQAVLLLHPSAHVEKIAAKRIKIITGNATVEVTASDAISIEKASWHPDQGMDLQTLKLVIHYGTAPCKGSLILKKLT